MNLFQRRVQVLIAQQKEGFKGVPYKTGETEVLAIPANPLDNPLVIKFSLTMTLSGALPSDNNIVIYNLNDKHLNFVKNKGYSVRFLAGYGNELDMIYEGQIDNVHIEKKDTDIVTTIKLVNKTFDITKAMFSTNYLGIVEVKQLIKDALKPTDIPYIGINAIPSAIKTNYSFHGNLKTLFENLLPPLGVQWFVNGSFLEFARYGKVSGTETVSLNQHTGMIHTPVLTTSGLIARSLLNSRLAVNNAVKINTDPVMIMSDGRTNNNLADAYSGTYKIIQVTHHGDNRNGLFFSDLTCTEINNS